jgi:hypothetical protein
MLEQYNPYAVPEQFALSEEQLEHYQDAFDPFRDAASEIVTEIDIQRYTQNIDPYGSEDMYEDFFNGDGDFLQGAPGFLGGGSDKAVFELPGKAGKEFVMKRMRLNPQDKHILEQNPGMTPQDLLRTKLMRSAAPLVVGEGVEGLEQLVGLDLERGLMVTSRMAGEMTRNMSGVGMLMKVHRSHVDKASNMLAAMRERGLHFHNSGGIFFDGKAGFGIADYTLEELGDNNRGSLENAESFLHYALADHKLMEANMQAKQMRAPMPRGWRNVSATGVRAMHRGSLMKYARKVDVEQGVASAEAA